MAVPLVEFISLKYWLFPGNIPARSEEMNFDPHKVPMNQPEISHQTGPSFSWDITLAKSYMRRAKKTYIIHEIVY